MASSLSHSTVAPSCEARSVYERVRLSECEPFADHFEGNVNALFCVVSQDPPSASVRNAIEASAARAGIAPADIFWIALRGNENNNRGKVDLSHSAVESNCENTATNCENAESGIQPSAPLEAPALFRLIESVDPLCVVVTEQASAHTVSLAYNQPIKLDTCDDLLGRPSCAFVDFARMLKTDERKQQAWRLLKEMIQCMNIQ